MKIDKRFIFLTVAAMLMTSSAGLAQGNPPPRQAAPKAQPPANAQAAPAPAPAQSSAQQQQIRQAVARANNKLLAHATAGARADLQSVLASNDAAVLAALGRVLAQEKSYAEAQAKLQQAAQKNPADPAPQVYLGETLLTVGQEAAANAAFQKATQLARQQIQANAQNADAHYLLGVAQQRLKQYGTAVDHLERARQLQPNNPLPVFQLGVTRAFQEQWNPAVDLLSRALEMNGGIAYAYYYRGLAASKINRKDLMINDFHRFLQLAPNAPEAQRVRRVVQSG